MLNKYVGQSEENIRLLFADAEAEYKERGDESELHIIIFDEIDSICKARPHGPETRPRDTAPRHGPETRPRDTAPNALPRCAAPVPCTCTLHAPTA